MWDYKKIELNESYKFFISKNLKNLSFLSVLNLWQNSCEFRNFFLNLFAQIDFDCYRFETPSVTSATINQKFEFVVLKDMYLSEVPDNKTFETHFNQNDIVEFDNLGKNSILIVPCPVKTNSNYSHFAKFIKNAPISQKHNLLKQMANSILNRINDKPIWLSTAGDGVSWLHVRLDEKPKYYRFAPYKNRSN